MNAIGNGIAAKSFESKEAYMEYYKPGDGDSDREFGIQDNNSTIETYNDYADPMHDTRSDRSVSSEQGGRLDYGGQSGRPDYGVQSGRSDYGGQSGRPDYGGQSVGHSPSVQGKNTAANEYYRRSNHSQSSPNYAQGNQNYTQTDVRQTELRSRQSIKKAKQEQKKASKQRGIGIRNVIIAFLIVLIFFLLALVFCFMWFIVIPANETGVVVAPGEDTTRIQYMEPSEEELIDRGWIPSDLIKKYAEEFNINTEFLSKIFTGRIIYKEGGKIIYATINPNLKKHPYDWNALTWDKKRPAYNTAAHSALLGIDVSKYQNEIDWKKVAADGVQFAMIRLGYRGYSSGALVMDEYFKANIKGAQDSGIKVGIYFFSQAVNKDEAIEEAEYVLQEISGYDVSFPIVVDMEEVSGATARVDALDKNQVTEIMIAFCDRIKQDGFTPMIYANSKWFVSRMDMEQLEDYEKWVAQYFKTPSFPYAFSMWQFTDSGSVDGIKGNVDIDVAFIDFSNNEM